MIEMGVSPLAWMVVQIFSGTFASMTMGYLWFSESGLGRPWWRYQFPNRQFGDVKGMKSYCDPIVTHFLAMTVQSSLLLALTRISRELFHPEVPAFLVPIICIAFLAIIVACNNIPHYAYSMKPLPLFCICSGFDGVQITICYITIYLLGTFA